MNGTRVCSIDGCEKRPHGRGLCPMHYRRWRLSGGQVAKVYANPEEAFAARTKRDGECIVWTGSDDGYGYGMINIDRKTWRVHKYAWIRAGHSIPAGMTLDHTCHVRNCVNLDHLRLATRQQQSQNKAGAAANNEAGMRGVGRHGNKWRARVRHKGNLHYGGSFATKEEAAEAAKQLRLELFTHNEADRRNQN